MTILANNDSYMLISVVLSILTGFDLTYSSVKYVGDRIFLKYIFGILLKYFMVWMVLIKPIRKNPKRIYQMLLIQYSWMHTIHCFQLNIQTTRSALKHAQISHKM